MISRDVNKTQIFLSVNSILVSNKIDVANHFNIYFNSIANNLANSLPPNLNLDPLENLTRVPAYMKLFPVSRQECFYHIKSLKKTKNTCKSTVSVELFKFIPSYLLDTLCNIINEAMSLGVFPKHLKCAIITPIFKGGDKLMMSNYRPISVLPFMSKIFESCLLRRLKSFMNKFSIISPCQFGFMKGKSTNDAITASTNYLYDALDD